MSTAAGTARTARTAGTAASLDRDTAAAVAGAVPDPEVPVLSLLDLGILRDVRVDGQGGVSVDITPTYSGCPAVDAIRADVGTALRAAGFTDVEVRLVLAPAWTTDDITDEGRRKLQDYGIAPPRARADGAAGATGNVVPLTLSVRCPRCGSPDTRQVSRFGSTACKAQWQCRSCLEPFDEFKTL